MLFYCLTNHIQKCKEDLTPLPSLRSKANKVIWEILPYIPAWFAFKLGHAKIPYLHHLFKYNIVLTPHCHESYISYLLSIVNPTNMQ